MSPYNGHLSTGFLNASLVWLLSQSVIPFTPTTPVSDSSTPAVSQGTHQQHRTPDSYAHGRNAVEMRVCTALDGTTTTGSSTSRFPWQPPNSKPSRRPPLIGSVKANSRDGDLAVVAPLTPQVGNKWFPVRQRITAANRADQTSCMSTTATITRIDTYHTHQTVDQQSISVHHYQNNLQRRRSILYHSNRENADPSLSTLPRSPDKSKLRATWSLESRG